MMKIALELNEEEYRTMDRALIERLGKLLVGCPAYNRYDALRAKLHDAMSSAVEAEVGDGE
jgi:hypothetical protein